MQHAHSPYATKSGEILNKRAEPAWCQGETEGVTVHKTLSVGNDRISVLSDTFRDAPPNPDLIRISTKRPRF